jgi:hypothetical protein
VADDVKKWKFAHPDFEVDDEALRTMSPFPSLFANDFIAYMQSKGQHGEEVVTFVRDLHRELVWAYSMWAKAQQNADLSGLIADLINNSSHGAEYQFTAKFLRDYARANNIKLPSDLANDKPWQNIAPANAAPLA